MLYQVSILKTFSLSLSLIFWYNKPPIYKLSGWELSKKRNTFPCPILSVSLCVWCMLSHVCILYKKLWFSALYCCTVVHHEALPNEDLIELSPRERAKRDKRKKKEPKSFSTQKIERGFSWFEEALLIFEAQDPNVEWYVKAAAAIQNAIQCGHEQEKRVTTQMSLDYFFKRVDRIESSKELEPVPSVRREWNCSLLSFSCCWRSFSSTVSYPVSFLESVTLAAPFMPAVVMQCCTFQGAIL